jgi:lysophospholipase L1-like esterase
MSAARKNSRTKLDALAKTWYYVRGLMLVLLCAFTAQAQGLEFTYKSYGVENEKDNVIQNAAHLNDLFEDLFRQRTYNDRKISIIHIGDSHIQADFMTNIVRRNLQQYFGNAGRGLVVPGRVAGTNEPFNIISGSQVKWNSKRASHMEIAMPIGIGATTIQTNLPGARLDIAMNDLWLDYGFNSVTLFYQKDISSFEFLITDSVHTQLGIIKSFGEDPFVNYSRLHLPHNVRSISIEAIKTSAEQSQATIFGLEFENGKNGILYHAIGANGAKYVHYDAAQYFARQTTALKPALFIISLGTNEAIDYPYLDRHFTERIDRLVNTLRLNNPLAKFLLVTPPDAFRKRSKPNPGIRLIRDKILEYAVENGLAFYDSYKVMGGENSAALWREAGLLRSDGVHFTKDGYIHQGNLFFSALLKSYNNYVPLRHP